MTERTSNVAFLTVMEAPPLDNVGWYARVLSERDYTSPIAEVHRYGGLSFTSEGNAEGGGKITLDADDPIFTRPLPLGETTPLVEQEALWQIIENGLVRAEFLAEDVAEDVILTRDGPRSTVIAGRGTGSVLEWAAVLPAGMPNPTSLERKFNAPPMSVWLTLFNEAKAAGFLTWVKPLFTATADSFGASWGGAQELTVRAGEDLLTLLTRWCEQGDYSWRMLPGFRLQVMKNPGRHLEGSVVFTQHRAQNEHKRKISRREIANVVYVDSGDDGIAIAQSSDSQSRYRKRATWVSAGDTDDASGRSAVANVTLALRKDAKTSRTVKVPADAPNRIPFTDFDVHDWITLELPESASESGAMKVDGIAMEIDRDGVPTVELTLMSRFDAQALRLKRALDRLGARSTSTSTSSPIPVSKIITATRITDFADVDAAGIQTGDLLRWDGAKFVDVTPVLGMLADYTGTPADGDVLVFDADLNQWKPGAPTGGGGGGATSLDELTDVDAAAPEHGDVLVYDSTIGEWIAAPTAGSSVEDASASVKGVIRLTGDLGGTADSPTVPALLSKETIGTAASLMTTHLAAEDPHSQYLKEADAATTYAPIGAARKEQLFHRAGTLAVVTGTNKFWNRSGVARTVHLVWISVTDAPGTNPVVVDAHKDGVTIFTDQGKRPSIGAGAKDAVSATPDVVVWENNTAITFDIDGVGAAGTTGANLTIGLVYS